MTRDTAPLERFLAERAFASLPERRGARRIGAEIEVIPVRAVDRTRVPIATGAPHGTHALLRAHGAARGWTEHRGTSGTPEFRTPDGARLGFEPGGQLELSTAPHATASALLDGALATLGELRRAAEVVGILLVARGVDPCNELQDVPPQLDARRYVRMAEYFGAASAGVAMMRQTASIQLAFDYGDEWRVRWRAANALAPYLTAIFANSAVYAGRATGHCSFRAHLWRTLDPERTGFDNGSGEPVRSYLDFALQARWIFAPDADGRFLSFRDWWERGDFTVAHWAEHLSTLFPEVRPRGYLELRSVDAIEPEWLAAPLALAAGTLYAPGAPLRTLELLEEVDADTLREAGQLGVRAPRVAERTAQLVALAVAGCRSMPDFITPAHLESAEKFFESYTLRGRSPSDEPELVSAC